MARMSTTLATLTATLVAQVSAAPVATTTPRTMALPNPDGDLSCGSCINNPRTWASSATRSVCTSCNQAVFPTYYINKFDSLSNAKAADICTAGAEKPLAFSGSDMGVYISGQMCVTFLEAARIWYYANPNESNENCVGALQIMSGEAVPCGKTADGDHCFAVKGKQGTADPGNIWQDDNTADDDDTPELTMNEPQRPCSRRCPP